MNEAKPGMRSAVERSVLVLGHGVEAALVCKALEAAQYQVQLASWEEGSAPEIVGDGNYRLKRLEGHVGGFRAFLQDEGETTRLFRAAAIVVATGNKRLYPQERYQHFGVRPSPNVLSVPEMGRRLENVIDISAWLSTRSRRVLLMLDLGGETPKETATEALELAQEIQSRLLAEVYVLYQNLRVDTWNLEALTRRMRQAGVVFCRYAEPHIEVGDSAVRVDYEEGSLEGDLLVLPEVVAPADENRALAALLDIRLGEDGYLQALNVRHYRAGLSSRKGIFVAGRCHMEADPATLQEDALLAVASVGDLLGQGYLEPEVVLAHVDPAKCIRCLTCIRSCPHAAVELTEYEQVTAAKVVELACWGCGACVANCPVQAIEMIGQALPSWANGERVAV